MLQSFLTADENLTNDRLPVVFVSCVDDDLEAMIDGIGDLGDVSPQEILMCAKCIGECKIF